MRRKCILLVLVMILASQGFSRAHSQESKLTEEQTYNLGIQAYIYAYPLVIMEMTKRVFISRRAPINQFVHAESFPSPEMRAVIRPNVDTLYSTAWLDLSHEPLILSVPNTGGRYYVIQLLDAWTETFAVPGKRTTGTKANHFAIIGPDWKGTLPKGVQKIKAPTNMIWIIGRVQTNGVADYANVHQIQRGFNLTSLGAWRKPATSAATLPINPLTNRSAPPPQQVARMDAATFFKTFAELLKTNLPHAADAPLLAQLKAIGIEVGKDFDAGAIDPNTVKGLERAVKDAPKLLTGNLMKNRQMNNGWGFPVKIGRYGTAYLDRASIALFALGALAPEDALYGGTSVDTEGQTLKGSNRYVLHFDKDAMPPVRAFWSVTLYAPDGFFAANSINRYAIGDRDKLLHNQDGSLDIYIQHDRPEKGKDSNWLPAPDGEFNLSMRLYWPKPEVTNGTWKPPAVRRVQ